MAGTNPRSGFQLLLKTDDQPARSLQELDPSELESVRLAVESALDHARGSYDAPAPSADIGFSCEWWPPD